MIQRDSTWKEKELRKLANSRKTMEPPPHKPPYHRLDEFHNGAYECNHVSPYTKSAGNVDSQFLLLLQDWSSAGRLRLPLNQTIVVHGYDRSLPTNINLIRLINKHLKCKLTNIFATNLFPWIKPNGMNTRIQDRDLLLAAKLFAWPQIEIIRPRLVVCFGVKTFNAIRCARYLHKIDCLNNCVQNWWRDESTGALVFCQSHPGNLGKNNREKNGNAGQVDCDWREMINIYNNTFL